MVDLTSLAAVKAWLPLESTKDDKLITRLISQMSTATLNYLQRPCITLKTYPELRDGVGNQRMVLRNWPVVSITSLSVNGYNVPAANSPTQAGYTLATWDGTSAGNPQELTLTGYVFARGKNNVLITYEAGYAIFDQAFVVPSVAPYTVVFTPGPGSWAQDDGVTLNGVDLTPVADTQSPSEMQYSAAPTDIGAVTYTFNSAQAGQTVLINYSFTPAALEQGVIEWLCERYRYKDRIGQTSKSLGGTETSAYSLKGVPDYLQEIFDGYKKFLPV